MLIKQLMAAVISSKQKKFIELIEKNKCDPSILNQQYNDTTLLILCIKTNNLFMFAWLIELGCDINVADSYNMCVLEHIAKTDAVDFLLQLLKSSKPDLNKKISTGQSFFKCLLNNNAIKCIEYLKNLSLLPVKYFDKKFLPANVKYKFTLTNCYVIKNDLAILNQNSPEYQAAVNLDQQSKSDNELAMLSRLFTYFNQENLKSALIDFVNNKHSNMLFRDLARMIPLIKSKNKTLIPLNTDDRGEACIAPIEKLLESFKIRTINSYLPLIAMGQCVGNDLIGFVQSNFGASYFYFHSLNHYFIRINQYKFKTVIEGNLIFKMADVGTGRLEYLDRHGNRGGEVDFMEAYNSCNGKVFKIIDRQYFLNFSGQDIEITPYFYFKSVRTVERNETSLEADELVKFSIKQKLFLQKFDTTLSYTGPKYANLQQQDECVKPVAILPYLENHVESRNYFALGEESWHILGEKSLCL